MSSFTEAYLSTLGVLFAIPTFILLGYILIKLLMRVVKVRPKPKKLSKTTANMYAEGVQQYIDDAHDSQNYVALADENLTTLKKSLLEDQIIPIHLESKYTFEIDPTDFVYNLINGVKPKAVLTVKK